VCRVCGDPALSDRLLCQQHRNRTAKEQRSSTAAEAASKPCSAEGCTNQRHRMPSQTVPYCLEHWRDYNAKLADARRSEPAVLTKTCPECGTVFTTTSASLRYEKPECRQAVKNRQVLVRHREIQSRGLGVTVTEKRCCTCGETKPAADFYRNGTQPDGLSPRCKLDDKKSKATTNQARPRMGQRRTVTKRLGSYNIILAARRIAGYVGDSVVDAYDAIYDGQHGQCPWCGKPGTRQTEMFRHEGVGWWPVSKEIMVIDHDHTCCPSGRSCGGCVRCLMHRTCNLQYQSNFKDLPELMARMARMGPLDRA
jgi:Recombination endonuclease VII